MPKNTDVVYAFIDSQNLNLSIKHDLYDKSNTKIYTGWQLDFSRFYIYLQDKYNVSKAFLFIGYINKKKNLSLYSHLRSAGYDLVFKPTLQHNGKIKGNVDAELVLHAMIEYPNYDKAIIVSGDGDYHCLIEYLEKNKKLSKLLIPNKHSYSSLLRKFIPYIAFLSGLQSKLK